MKFTCTQENLSQGLNTVAHINSKNINLPILNNVLLKVRKEGITLISTNLELAIKTKIRGKIETEGEFTTNAKLFMDFVNTLKKENVVINLEDKNIHIKGENHQTSIRGMEASDFPVIPDVEPKHEYTVPSRDFHEALSQTLFAASSDDSRPELNGIYIQLEKKQATFASTDSYRLAEKTIPLETKSEPKSIIVPTRSLVEVARIIDGEHNEDSVTIIVNDTQVLFRMTNTEVVSRIVAGEYPDYKQIIPKAFKNKVEFKTTEMIQAIKTTSLFCKQGINDVRISLEKRFKDITVNAENSILGKNVSNVPSISQDQEMDIVFNYKFLLDGLLHLSGETAILKTNEATSPALLMSAAKKDLLYIIMPIKQ